MAVDGNDVWAASGPHVIKYLRGKEVWLHLHWLHISNLLNVL